MIFLLYQACVKTLQESFAVADTLWLLMGFT